MRSINTKKTSNAGSAMGIIILRLMLFMSFKKKIIKLVNKLAKTKLPESPRYKVCGLLFIIAKGIIKANPEREINTHSEFPGKKAKTKMNAKIINVDKFKSAPS